MRWWMSIVFLPTACVALFSKIEIDVLMAIIDYFQPSYLEILDDWRLLRNFTFPLRHWVLTSVKDISQFQKELTWRGRPALVVVNEGSSAWTELKKIADDTNMRGTIWALFSKKRFTKSTFDDIYIPFDCQFLSINQAGILPTLTEVYKITSNGSVLSNHFGYWSPENGLSYPKTYFYSRRTDLNNHVFTAAIQHELNKSKVDPFIDTEKRNMSYQRWGLQECWDDTPCMVNYCSDHVFLEFSCDSSSSGPPYTYVYKDPNGSTTFGGYFYDIWKELEFRLKFKTEFHVIEKEQGKPMDLVAKGEYPFIVSPVTQDPKSAMLIGLSEPIYEAKIYLFGNRPGSELEWNSYLKPFSSETWFVTLGWMFGSSLAISILYRVAWGCNICEAEAEYYVFTFPVAFTTVFRAMCAQGSDVTPKSNACRLLFLSVYMTALVLTSAFSAALFSLLTIPVSRAPFSTFREVYTSSKGYRIGVVPNSDIYLGFKEIADRYSESEHSKLLRIMDTSTTAPMKVDQALERVCMRKNYIFMWDLPNVLDGLQELNRTCREKVMPGGPMVLREHMGFGMSKNNPYKEIIDLHLVQLKNEGILRRLLLNSWPPHIPDVTNTWVRVTLADISPILYMFSIGVILGCIFLMMERLRWNFKKKQSQIEASQSGRYFNRDEMFPSPLKPLSPLKNWNTEYTDWQQQEEGLHRRKYK